MKMGHNQNLGAKLMKYNMESMDSNSYFADISQTQIQPWGLSFFLWKWLSEVMELSVIHCNSYYL